MTTLRENAATPSTALAPIAAEVYSTLEAYFPDDSRFPVDMKWWATGVHTADALGSLEGIVWSTFANYQTPSQCAFLGQAIDGLKKRLDYQSVYQAYLLQQMTEAEFREASKSFAYSPTSVNEGWLRAGLRCLGTYTKAEFTVSELAEMFGTDEQSVESVIEPRNEPEA